MELEEWFDDPVEEEDLFFSQPPKPKQYLSYRFSGLNVEDVTVENYEEMLTASLAEQISMFIPPSGSFKTPDLRR